MSQPPPTYDQAILVGSNFSQCQTTENVVQKEPSVHVFVNPSAPDNINNVATSIVQPQPQGQAMVNTENRNMHSVSARSLELIEIEDYYCWSIFNMLCCGICFGCVACYYSSKTNKMKLRGDIQNALDASRTARTINIITTVLGIIIISINLFLKFNSV